MNVNWEGLLPIQGEIIVIEDDPTLRELMVTIVAEVGAKALAFETADDALTYLLQASCAGQASEPWTELRRSRRLACAWQQLSAANTSCNWWP
ncbi:hypothetical protein D3C87_1379920 [compost metagenome]